MSEKYVVVHRTQNAFGGQDLALFWRPEGKGYTPDFDQAGRYSREAALEIEKSTHGTNEAFREDDLAPRTYKTLELCRLPTVKIGEVYYDPDSHQFIQPRGLVGDMVVCGEHTTFFNDAKTNICMTKYEKTAFKRMRLVLAPESFDMAELDGGIHAWRVRGNMSYGRVERP